MTNQQLNPTHSKSDANMAKKYAQRCQRGGKSEPKGGQREPKGTQRMTKGTKKAITTSPKEAQRSHVWPQGATNTKNMKKGRFGGRGILGAKVVPKASKNEVRKSKQKTSRFSSVLAQF